MFTKAILICCLLVVYLQSVIVSSVLSTNTKKSKNDYTTLAIKVGSAQQSLTVLLDTTNSDSWWFDPNIDPSELTSGQDTYDYNRSSTYHRAAFTTTYDWNYYGEAVNGTGGGYDTVRLSNDVSLLQSYFGLSTTNPNIISEEVLDGVVALGRDSSIMTNLSLISMDVDDDKLYFGEYPDSIKNYTNVTISQRLRQLRSAWKFDLTDVLYPLGSRGDGSLVTCPCVGVIDVGSPYIGIAISSTQYETLWSSIGTSGNCNETTLICKDTDKILPYIIIEFHNVSVVLSKSDYVQDSKLLFKRLPVANTSGTPVLYFGKPFLKTRVVSLGKHSEDPLKDWIIITMKKSTNNSHWITILIIFLAVLVFSAVFFGVFWHYNKIPPPVIGNVEEQSLLPSQAGQQLGSATGAAPVSNDDLRTRRLQNLEQSNQPQ